MCWMAGAAFLNVSSFKHRTDSHTPGKGLDISATVDTHTLTLKHTRLSEYETIIPQAISFWENSMGR